MLVLARCKGEKIEIDGCALIRVARIEEDRVRLDITAPFSKVSLAESFSEHPLVLDPMEQQAQQAISAECLADRRVAVVTLLDIRRRSGSSNLRINLGIRVPGGATVRRAEVAKQAVPVHLRFPWHRYHPTARHWRSIREGIHILLPQQ